MNQQKKNQQSKGPKVKREAAPEVQLDFREVDIDTALDKKRQLWMGEKKIGKTVNANRAGAYFLKFEAGHSHIRHHGMVVKDWNHFRGIARSIIVQKRAGRFPFDKVCIDTLGECYKMCTSWINAKYGIMHEGDMGHGKGYSLIENAFREVIMPLSNLGLGVIFLAHTDEKEFKDDRTGETYNKAVPDMPKGCRRVVGGMVDLLLYFTMRWNEDTERWERVIKTSPTKFYEAGVRYPDGWQKRLPVELPMHWDALKAAWDAGRPEGEPESPPEPEPLPEPEPEPDPEPQQAPEPEPQPEPPPEEDKPAQAKQEAPPSNGKVKPSSTAPAQDTGWLDVPKSTNIAAARHSANGCELRFASSGDVYRYADVGRALFDEMLASDSPGSFFSEKIRTVFRFQKIAEQPENAPKDEEPKQQRRTGTKLG